MDAGEEKKRLRGVVRERLARMTPEGFRERSAGVCARVQEAVDEIGGGVLVFLPDYCKSGHLEPGHLEPGYLEPGYLEPDIEPAISGWLAAGRVVAAPRCEWEHGTFEPVRLRSLDDVEVRRFGVREPKGAERVEAGALGIALVPGTAFDVAGGRLGRGGGFYDRFLAGLPPTVRRLGVCFAAQMVERVPVEAHDARVDVIATEEGLIWPEGGRGGAAKDR